MDLSQSCSRPGSRLEVAEYGAESTELVMYIICIMSQLTYPNILFCFVHRVQQLCRTLTKLCIYCKFMGTAYENLLRISTSQAATVE